MGLMLNLRQIFLVPVLGIAAFIAIPSVSVPDRSVSSPLLLAQNNQFKISQMRMVKDNTLTAGRYTVEGQLTNNGTDAVRSLLVVYRLYRQEGDILVQVENNQATVNPRELQSGETGQFGRVFSEVPQVFFIEAIASPEGPIEVNECYADGLARREMCRLQLNATEVYPLSIKN